MEIMTVLYLAAPDVESMGSKLYSKGVQIGKWAAILAIMFIAFKYFANRKEQASEHLQSVIKGVFLLVLAPTIIGILFWLATSLKV